MIPTQTTGPRLPPDEARDDAAITGRNGGGPGEAPPATPGRSSDQMCNRCRRSGGQMTTVEMGPYRYRLCHICTGRINKTTILKPVVCAHPFSRARRDDGKTTYQCIDCFEPVPGPPECSPEKRCGCEKCVDAGHAGLSLVVPVGLFGGLMLALAVASGHARYLIEHLPLPEPGLNGWPLFVLGATAAYVTWRMRNAETTPHPSLEELLNFDSQPEGEDPWYGTSPFTDVDPDQTLPTLLPADPEAWT